MISDIGDAAIVPEREVADRPIVVINELRLETVLEQLRQKFIGLRFVITLNGGHVLRIGEDGLAPCLRMGADDEMGQGGRHGALFVSQALLERAPGIVAPGKEDAAPPFERAFTGTGSVS